MFETYSPQIQKLLKKAGVKTGDKLVVVTKEETKEGILMPRPEIGDKESLILKLDSGYNVGIKYEKNMFVRKNRHAAGKELVEEERYELGKARHIERLHFDEKKPKIAIIATGGTIASRVEYRTGGVTGMEKPSEFLQNVPELAGFVNVTAMHSPFTKMSEDMDASDWAKIAELVARELNKGCKGVVVTHGTDTLHFTAYALSFMLQNLAKPVILVGSQRSSDRGSSDAYINILCASQAATTDIGEVAICMHATTDDDSCLLIRGTKARKMHTSRRDAFRPINEKPIAKIWPDGRLERLSSYRKRDDSQKVKADTKLEERIAIVKAYPGSDPGVFDYYLSKGYKGFVVEGTGLGHVPSFAKKSWIKTIQRVTNKGIPVVVTPETLYGRVNSDVYTNLRILFHESGAIPGEDMLPETAYVKLMWVLGHTKKPDDVRKLMLTNMAGEITKRTTPDAFLY